MKLLIEYKLNCKKCDKEYILFITQHFYNSNRYKKHCSYLCSNSHKRTEKSKLKTSLSCKKSVKVKEANKANAINASNWFKQNPEKVAQRNINLSKSLIESFKNGRKVLGGRVKWFEINCSKGIIKVQGTYEVRTVKILDKWKENNKIFDWEYTDDRIQYIGLDNKEHNYLLDFKVWDNEKTFYYIETKGYKTETDELKWQELIKQNIPFIVWYKQEIKTHEEHIYRIK